MTEKGRGSSSSEGISYLKALPIRQLSDIDVVKIELSAGNIVIAKITPLAKKSLEDTERAVEELCAFVNMIGGEIARLGDERLVVTPPSIKIWKEKENLE
ncbi:MAG: cell division protein SepF [Candidatus Bathyarchaeota archaeon]